MSDPSDAPHNGPKEDRATKVRRLNQKAHALGELADEMVNLLSQHNELNWAQIFANFAKDIRGAQTDKARKSAIKYINSIYGGMGSWNDFYLHGFGEPEAHRSSLSYQIQSGGHAMLAEMESGVQEAPLGLLSWLAQLLK